MMPRHSEHWKLEPAAAQKAHALGQRAKKGASTDADALA
jgi:hypothetical protein